jgi:hypothetical protein
MYSDIDSVVGKCSIYPTFQRQNAKEPLKLHEFPSHLWHNPTRLSLTLVSDAQIHTFIAKLSNNKAADIWSITAEHLNFTSEELVPVLVILMNQILLERKLPDSIKLSIATPIPKKSQNQTDPYKFWRITIIPLLGKLLERHLIYLSHDILDKAQSPVQFGFNVTQQLFS